MKTQTARLQAIRLALETRQDAVEKATVLIYRMQTADEQVASVTVHENGVGFSAFDAGIMSDYARYILQNRWNRRRGQILTPRQLAVARKKILRYVSQIARLTEGKVATQN